MRNVVFVAPFPLETTLRFVRAVGSLSGIRLLGIWQKPPQGPEGRLFADIVTVADALDTRQLVEATRALVARHGPVDRVVGILEPLQVQLAEVRRHFGLDGTDVDTADVFRDKARMKDALRAHGLPCARHRLLTSWQDADVFAREVGFPMVLKPPAGMACKATWRIRSVDELRQALEAVKPSPDNPTLAEELLVGRELSFETLVVGGEVRFYALTHYYPGPLEVVENPWIQWVVLVPREIASADYDDGRKLGFAAVKALGLRDGMTHMEWFRRTDGSLAIGEIAARPPGANIVRLHSLAHDADLYRAWARAVIDGAFDGPIEQRYATGCAFFRGPGRGRVVRVEGLDRAQHLVGEHVVESVLPEIGAPKSDSYEGDGYAIVRHPDTDVVRRALATLIDTVRVHYA
ncbi:MAG: ATP-grasp domain-containing protein [Deltaproteobacteria bacterium]|nr:ATP-grasp domain-containing protein [Deltaproteobacteria bacterium]